MNSNPLTQFAWLSIACSLATIILKTVAFFLTGSVGLLSDALESIVNLVAAIISFLAIKLAYKPPDENHLYGHSKAEYFSSIIEGGLIIVAALVIAGTAIERILHPKDIENIDIGLVVSVVASVINFGVAMILLKAGKKHNSISLEADGHHLMTDVWTSVAVVIGVGVVAVTGMTIFDPIIAILVALNIIFTGYRLIRESAMGFLDTALVKEDLDTIKTIIKSHCTEVIKYHALRTRQSGRRKFISFHLLVPSDWSIKQGHDLAEIIEDKIRKAIEHVTITTHIEPFGDKKSDEDIPLDREVK